MNEEIALDINNCLLEADKSIGKFKSRMGIWESSPLIGETDEILNNQFVSSLVSIATGDFEYSLKRISFAARTKKPNSVGYNPLVFGAADFSMQYNNIAQNITNQAERTVIDATVKIQVITPDFNIDINEEPISIGAFLNNSVFGPNGLKNNNLIIPKNSTINILLTVRSLMDQSLVGDSNAPTAFKILALIDGAKRFIQ